MKDIYQFDPDDAFRFADEQHTQTFKRGNELHFKSCPYCHGGSGRDQKTFSIDLKTGKFNCLRASCGAHGNMLTLSKDFDFSLGDMTDEYMNRRKQFKTLTNKNKPKPEANATNYLKSRGISKDTTHAYDVTVRKDDKSVLLFPFYDENDVLTFVKYRKTDFDKAKDKNKEWCEEGCRPILFGMNHINPENKTLVLTEGQIDSLSVAEAGIDNAVSVPNGAKGFTWIPYCWDFLARFDTLIVFGDCEDGSISLLEEMRLRFHGQVKHVRPEDYQDCKDANEILQKHGTDAVRRAVMRAVPVKNPHIKPLEEVKRVELSKMEKFSTGFDWLDKTLGGFYFGQLVLLTGERGEGKSTLASQFATFAVKAGYPVFFYSGELMDWYFQSWFEYQVAGAEHVNKLVSNLGYESYSVRGEVVPNVQHWYSGKMFIYDGGIVGEDDEDEALLQTMESAVQQYGCRVLFLDNLMTAIWDDLGKDLYREQTNFVKALATMAKLYNVLIVLIAHPRKSSGGDFSNDSVAGSGNITNLVDVTIRYSRPDNDSSSDRRFLSVLKNRLTGKIDRTGVELYFEESSKRISESEIDFDWELGWEDELDFLPIQDDVEPVFN